MTAPPPIFASNTNYSAGPDAGTPTKVDPATPSNGFIAGTAIAPQHVNYLVAQLVAAGRAAWLRQAAFTRIVGDGYTDLDTAIGVCQAPDGRLVVLRWDSSTPGLLLDDSETSVPAGDISSIDDHPIGAVTDMVNDGTHLVATCNANDTSVGMVYSADNGATWIAGVRAGSVGSVGRTRLVWNANKSKLHSAGLDDANVYTNTSPPTGAWSSAASGVSDVDGLAVLSNGNLYALGGATPSIKVSSDGGGTFGADASQIPNPSDYAESGCIVGNNGASIYHVGRVSAGASLRVCRRTGAAGWTLTATLAAPSAGNVGGRPRILMCAQTGLLVIAAPIGSAQTALWASIDGSDFLGPLLVTPQVDIDGWGIGGGRLVSSSGEVISMSEGIQ